jgi:hypothetical protein
MEATDVVIESSSLTFASFSTLCPGHSRINAGPDTGGIGTASQDPTLVQARIQEITSGTPDLIAEIAERRSVRVGKQLTTQVWKGGTFSATHFVSRLKRKYSSGIFLQIQLVPYTILPEYHEALASKA